MGLSNLQYELAPHREHGQCSIVRSSAPFLYLLSQRLPLQTDQYDSPLKIRTRKTLGIPSPVFHDVINSTARPFIESSWRVLECVDVETGRS